MKKYSSIFILLVLSLLLITVTGCNQNQTSSKSTKKVGESITSEAEAKGEDENTKDSEDSKDTNTGDASTSKAAANKSQSAQKKDDSENAEAVKYNSRSEIPEEKRNAMSALTGKWQSQTPTDTGVSVVKVKFDNVGGFTLATVTGDSEYAHVGSYEITGNKMTLSATTGGPAKEEDSYELRMEPVVFEYTYSENAEKTQLVMTPANDSAKELTGTSAITLTKS